jgi:hypothetical protein
MNPISARAPRSFFILLIPFLFAYSYFLIVNYTEGDQRSYRVLYDALSNANFSEVPEISNIYVIASDWLSFYILWIPAKIGIDKDFFIACSNLLLLGCLYFVLLKHRVNYALIILFMLNYYIIVLMTGAERLKFSMIFLLLSYLSKGRMKKIVFACMSVLCHMQTLLLFFSVFFGRYSRQLAMMLANGKIKKRDIFLLIFMLTFLAVFIYFQLSWIQSKAMAYMGDGLHITDVMQIIIILSVGLFLLSNKSLYVLTMLPLFLSVLLLGGMRVNMIAFVVFMYLSLKEGRGNHILIHFLALYFFIKSIPFVQNILEHGDGYYGI